MRIIVSPSSDRSFWSHIAIIVSLDKETLFDLFHERVYVNLTTFRSEDFAFNFLVERLE
jgi:hypothetical protein